MGAAPTAPTREYLYAGGLKVATVTGSTPMYHLRDHLSVRVNTDSSGMLIGEQGHYPFGDIWYPLNTTTKEMFTTYERDPETGTPAPPAPATTTPWPATTRIASAAFRRLTRFQEISAIPNR